ncbi:MAG: acyl-CoA dehydrogenase family protein [Oscillospiraceae bacterium]|nr:acyl-CoA dehydrogenase family protein [Oscillospiraceae bacterium]
MDFTLSKEQALVQKMYREFAENEVKPLAQEVDENERFPEETVKKMSKLGMMGIYFPKEVGGAGADVLSYVMAVEEMSKVCGTTGVIISAHTSLCAAPIFENGTPAQKAAYLPKLCSGEWIGAFGLTEPGAGTDAQGQQTVAVLDPETNEWVLNGSKIFITNAGYADVFIIIAVTGTVLDRKGRKTKEISAFIVERTDKGFSVGKHEKKMGIRGSSTCELIMEDCRIPADRLLGKKGKGFALAMKTLDGGRIGIAAQALGIAEGALDETVAYVKERKQFGRSIAAFQNTQFELAEMKARIEAAKLLVYKAALKKQGVMDGTVKEAYSVEAAEAKLIASRTASDVTRRCLQLFGGYGYTRDYPIERMMRDAKITEIYEGTSEVQMMVISGALLR